MKHRGLAFSGALLASSIVMLALGARPPDSQSAPTFVGTEACKQCHEEQWTSFARNVHGLAEKDAALLGQTGCESCHGPGSLHVEAGGDRSHPGFASIRNFQTMGPQDVVSACQSCHRAGDVLHWEQSAHAREEYSCVTCHSVHRPRSQAQAKLLKAEDTNRLCLQCHKDKRAGMHRSAHMPLREGSMDCADCHNPHGSPADRQLRAANVSDLCTKCHMDKRGPFLWEHPPVRENCVTCHEPHGSNNDKVLAGRRPFLCQRCHNVTRHPGTLYDAQDLASNRLMNRSCTNCHVQVHGSNHPSGRTFLR